MARVGVFIGQFDSHSTIAFDSLASYAANLRAVEKVRLLGLRPKVDVKTLAEEIRRERLDRIVLAGDSPGHFKPAFTRAMQLAGGDPAEVRLASFREHGASSSEATDRAKAILACAVHGVPYPLVAVPKPTVVNPATLVIGGGVAGIQTALEIADAGKKVILVERSGTIGGHMAMFDKTFPTLDCAACILTPKMVAVAEHDMIELLTNSEVVGVTGNPGAYRVEIRRHARRVDEAACVACNVCTDICPISVLSEFDQGLTHRKAIYIPFPQAVPNAYLVDPEACLWVQSEGKRCGACAKKCPKECIDLAEEDRTVTFDVGTIVLATGYDLLDARKVERYGYGKYPNVLTALEFERITNASGPTGGKIVVKSKVANRRLKTDEWLATSDGAAPRSVAIIHCVGSRDANYNPYCSRVCCMYSLKFAHLVREKLPDATCYEFYIDMRAFGKGYEEFMERIKAEGAHVVRGRTAEVSEVDGRLVVKGEDIVQDRLVQYPVDLVILAVGLVPSAGTAELATLLGVPRDQDGWFSELNYNSEPTYTERGGVFVAGVCQGPKDIPDTVAQASAVAAGVLRSISSGRGVSDLSSLALSEIEARAMQMAAGKPQEATHGR
ncbi:MAG: CoB--CoM heterodisulfide reductase iron-sulfur subunit A family protein [Thermoanaerobaculaceae bacterium]|nr:CoB--CoM heterodisulfide reductase iron-sulfur subunit A family protein [Thermoanaerobaculaceae bacterium]MDI9622867.1 CoB--CoM heterodisulfide reductase iron-sulfur subunit A family protein [Acidobacteriota bacterium]NLH11697.1 CoB--CoM heterodisulfide reductase iron-sulfur subunit A family protein [Holophagae bacterium]HPW56761.1 CoB--CoM heterodisulfide reductase iron-sulfur subunit A family protein [Thermoanaerobaculaceae bacterium]